MEHISEALIKARVSLDQKPLSRDDRRKKPARRLFSNAAAKEPSWSPPQVVLNAKRLESQRVVSFSTRDPSHVAFDLLRTRVRKATQEHGWETLMVTSPTSGCGKTMIALNLAFSLARIPDCRVVLVDLDLIRPSVARTLGIRASASIADYLSGTASGENCFVQVAANLTVGLNDRPDKHASETIQGSKINDLISSISSNLVPDIIILDMPPMTPGDVVLAMLPKVDAALLVAASGKTTVNEVDECERQLSDQEKFLGVVLNKCAIASESYY